MDVLTALEVTLDKGKAVGALKAIQETCSFYERKIKEMDSDNSDAELVLKIIASEIESHGIQVDRSQETASPMCVF